MIIASIASNEDTVCLPWKPWEAEKSQAFEQFTCSLAFAPVSERWYRYSGKHLKLNLGDETMGDEAAKVRRSRNTQT